MDGDLEEPIDGRDDDPIDDEADGEDEDDPPEGALEGQLEGAGLTPLTDASTTSMLGIAFTSGTARRSTGGMALWVRRICCKAAKVKCANQSDEKAKTSV